MSRYLVSCVLAIGLIAGGRAGAAPCPRFLFVVDRSATMAQDPEGYLPGNPKYHGQTKLDLARGAIADVIKTYGDRVPFGLELFAAEAPAIVPGNEAVANQACFDATVIDVDV